MKKTVLFLILIAMVSSSILFAQARRTRESKNKFGSVYHVISGSDFTLTNTTTGETGTASDSIVGAVFFYERIFDSKFSMGLNGTSFLERNMTIAVGSETLEVVEQSTLILLHFKAYHKDHSAGGIKPYLGVGVGSLSVSSTITSATDTTGSTTSATIPITVISAGLDYFWESGGFRVEVGYLTGERSDLEGHDTYAAKYQATGSTGSIGVYWLF